MVECSIMRRCSSRRVCEPVAAERVGRVVRRGGAVDAVHQEERRAEQAGVLLEPPHLRHRHRGQLADQPDDLELARACRRTERPARRRDAARSGRPDPRCGRSVLRPSRSPGRAPSRSTCPWRPRSSASGICGSAPARQLLPASQPCRAKRSCSRSRLVRWQVGARFAAVGPVTERRRRSRRTRTGCSAPISPCSNRP